ncbi:MAG: DUF2271 domain-containing protein [Dechloromonas sp.]|uniref:DUF2271 domain-containing protein n=1 Tax=Sphingopyxis sp. SCN 67-31 TaxID=1660142 RepID=UPI000868BD65|nr:DUF2271 domain-containing protein [Sphingopyxis sp. SCN 67-31]KAB2921831.1 MAG: DUF2271 domain-containing protein [Dechloromonas sp.]ODU35147.1 MAG: hypothetical protein ABS88_01630 [Sphingopyxis sp. SCN 67-31]
MQSKQKFILTGVTFGAAGMMASPALAQTMDVTITIPRLTVAEYHKPYVALWIEQAGKPARTINVWYDTGKKNNAGIKWLRDMRQWWRTVGRTTPTPPNGVTGATRAPGAAKISFTSGKGGMPVLTAGAYTLVVEAAREGGGREVVKVPFTVSAAGTAKGSGKGSFELGAVSLTVRR